MLNSFSLFQKNSETKKLISDQGGSKDYGATFVKRNIDFYSETNATAFFVRKGKELRAKLAVIEKLKNHIDNYSSTPLISIDLYIKNIELAYVSISEMNLSQREKDLFQREILFSPKELLKLENIPVSQDFYSVYAKLVTMVNRNDSNDSGKNMKFLAKLTIAYRENIDNLYDNYSKALQANKQAIELINNAIKTENQHVLRR